MFEIEFKYYKQKEDLDYDKNEPLVFKNKFGKVDEDYPEDKLAKYILTQLARRDIFIYDVEIYSYTKKKVNFKLSKNGFSIAKSKFNNSDVAENCSISSEEEVANEPQDIPKITKAPPTNFQNLKRKIEDVKSRKILRKVAFVPPLTVDKKSFPYKFTINKVYPIYSERYNTNGIGMMVTTLDDNNDAVEVIDEYFVPANASLGYENEMNSSKRDNNDLLNWQGDRSSEGMINLRGK